MVRKKHEQTLEVLAFLQEGLYLSKMEGGKWAMEHMDLQFLSLIADALECYGTDQNMVADQNTAEAFVREMNNMIRTI